MALIKCPRCELNYIQENETCCAVCRRGMRGGEEAPEVELCTACGERPVGATHDLCAVCLSEERRQERRKPNAAERGNATADTNEDEDLDEIETDDAQEIDEELGEEFEKEIEDEGGDDDDDEETESIVDDLQEESLEALSEEELNETDDEVDDDY